MSAGFLAGLRLATLWAPILGVALIFETLLWEQAMFGSGLFSTTSEFLAWSVAVLLGGFAGAPAAVVERARAREEAPWWRDVVTALLAVLVVGVSCAFYYLEFGYTEAALAHGPEAGIAALAKQWVAMRASPERYFQECWICGVPYGVTLFLRARRVSVRLQVVLVPLATSLLAAPSALRLVRIETADFTATGFLVGEAMLFFLIPITLAIATRLDEWLVARRAANASS